MIAPRSRLIFWTGAVAVPFCLLAAMDPSRTALVTVVLGGFATLALADLALSLGLLDDTRAVLPEVVRLTLDREGEIKIELEDQSPRRIKLSLSLPPAFSSAFNDAVVHLPGDPPRTRISWPVASRERGNFKIENVHLETSSRLGLWAIRKLSPAKSEVRVYPNTMREQKNLAALFLNRGLAGIHAQRQVGKGREFEKLREYQPGDGFEDIHWKATAKRGFPVTKVFQIERTQELYVVIDASRLSARKLALPAAAGPGREEPAITSQLERFVTAAMVLGLAAERQGDHFGLISFDERVRGFIRAGSGKAHYGVCRDAVYTLAPRLVNPDFGELFSFIRMRLRRRALLIFLTNLDDPVMADGFLANLDLLARHHLVLVNMLAAPEIKPLFADDAVRTTDDLYRELGGHIQWQRIKEFSGVLKRRGISLAMLDTEMMCPQLVSQYIEVKRRQLL